MRLAARFAAKAVANEIERRWRILNQAAEDPQLHLLMLAPQIKDVGSPEHRGLQQWIEARRQTQAPETESWFLTDASGVQIARDPFNKQTLLADFSNRTYFHGGPRDLAEDDARSAVKPIVRAHLSSVYLSTASRSLKVAFSTPIWKENKVDGECLGVLGMSIEIGDFYELQTGLEVGQIAVLVDTRDDQVEDKPQNGLILHHPLLRSGRHQRSSARQEPMFRIQPRLAVRLKQICERGALEAGDPSVARGSLGIDASYHDPLASLDARGVTAAFEPVRIESRSPGLRDTGWVVIVQESPLQARSARMDRRHPTSLPLE
jgi:hypothetical protein